MSEYEDLPISILVIDDDSSICEVVRHMLETAGEQAFDEKRVGHPPMIRRLVPVTAFYK